MPLPLPLPFPWPLPLSLSWSSSPLPWPLSSPSSSSPSRWERVLSPAPARTLLQYFQTRAELPAAPSRVRRRSRGSGLPSRTSRQ
ncbi:hypothetical protein DMH26_09915 [Streptomyces sp. WAC 05379]|nr:hypothetical protein DMH26_09915 [Streptomyces sp. WAC 05379]